MPCYDPREANATHDLQLQIDVLQQKVDTLTQFLCEVTKDLEINTINNSDLKRWIIKHRAFDALRGNKK